MPNSLKKIKRTFWRCRCKAEKETLYYVHLPNLSQAKDARYTRFEMEVSPQIPIDEIPENYIEWNFNGTNLKHYELSLSRNVTYDKNIEVLARTGNPTADQYKKVKVQWVKEDRHDASFMPPAVNYTLQELNKNVANKLQELADKLNKTIGKGNLKIEINPIKIKGEFFNEQDKESRHYFEVLEGSVNGGLSFSGEILGYPPFLKILNIKNVSKVGMYITPKIEFVIAGGGTQRKTAETKKYIKNEMFLEATIKGCIETGLKAELLAGKEYIDFYINGFGEGCVSGKYKYNFTQNKEETKGFYLDPIILGVKAKIKSIGVFDFELVDIDKTWSITDKIRLDGKEDE